MGQKFYKSEKNLAKSTHDSSKFNKIEIISKKWGKLFNGSKKMILIGHSSNDTLQAGKGNDILIGGKAMIN